MECGLADPLQHVGSREWHLNCNWKVFCDNYLVRSKYGATNRLFCSMASCHRYPLLRLPAKPFASLDSCTPLRATQTGDSQGIIDMSGPQDCINDGHLMPLSLTLVSS